MRKIKGDRKIWQINHSLKILRQLTKINKRNKKRKRKHYWSSKIITHIITVPEQLSLIYNLDITLAFFRHVLDEIELCGCNDKIYFDFRQVQYISNDAIMYFIALISNVQRLAVCNITCAGNIPLATNARSTLEKSGFYKFVQTRNHRIIEPDNCVQISNGQDADGELAASICDFVHRVSGKSRKDTKRLFPMIIELMTNTHQHAYRIEQNVMDENWYIFAEDTDDSIHFVFLDTGAGIPATIRKNIAEQWRDRTASFMEGSDDQYDAQYISSALRGEFRSETCQQYRGKGLPEIYHDSQTGMISELIIISGCGECSVDSRGTILEHSLVTAFVGTLFSWKFSK